MEYKVHGSTMQTLDVTMSQGESVYTESGGMAWMGGNIAMETNTKGGFMAGLGRKLAGESFFMTTYTCQSSRGFVTFTPEAPGVVLPMELQAGRTAHLSKRCFHVCRINRQTGDAFP